MSHSSALALDTLRLHSTLYTGQWMRTDIAGRTGVTTRLAGVEDWLLIDGFHRRCSPEALLHRWGRGTVRQRDWMRLCLSAVSFLTELPADGEAVALTSIGPVSDAPDVVDIGIQVSDAWQRQGLGTALVCQGARLARSSGARLLTAQVQASNQPMLKVLRSLDADFTAPEHGQVTARIDLSSV
ncbi:GNAT family N-acetyltransferase [Streptomyces phyllanthi]|uniref:GNAT family N-acetyltransferase n=1 Tax=Streptomyces phyllanthi TaxID=1803180 RepID=A0A5N8VWQ2_9ACTN|nr:GNAT family N-acetyltransferase [Streptomyces phyllanthi]MPY38488.1 GNAT family N-acetyltransferase [Streptomyces phyllanthi]